MIAVAGGLVASLVIVILRGFAQWLRAARVHRYWRQLLKRPVAIIWSEYSNEVLSENDPLIALVRKQGITHFISRGNALANAAISQFLSRDMHFHKFKTHGDKTHEDDSNKNLILIGSPATNNYSRFIFENLKKTAALTFDIEYDETKIRIVDRENNRSYGAVVDGTNTGVDYALVIKTHRASSRGRCCLLLCGASQWGVEGAAKIVTSAKSLRRVSRPFSGGVDTAFLVKVDVVTNTVQNAEIARIGKGSGKYVRSLRKLEEP